MLDPNQHQSKFGVDYIRALVSQCTITGTTGLLLRHIGYHVSLNERDPVPARVESATTVVG